MYTAKRVRVSMSSRLAYREGEPHITSNFPVMVKPFFAHKVIIFFFFFQLKKVAKDIAVIMLMVFLFCLVHAVDFTYTTRTTFIYPDDKQLHNSPRPA